MSSITERDEWIKQDPQCQPLDQELRQLILDLVDHSFICWPFKPSPEEREESRMVNEICQDLGNKILAKYGRPGFITVPLSADYAVLVQLRMNNDCDESGYYRKYPNEVRLVLEPLEFIQLVSCPA